MSKQKSWFKKVQAIVAIIFVTSTMLSDASRASVLASPILAIPAPNQFVNLSQPSQFPVLRGLKLDPKDPLKMEFVIDCADKGKVTQDEAQKLIRYFLAALTVPKADLWVNLSPYESDRITPDSVAVTDLGKDLLSQDYVLKQLSSSVTYPESASGKEYWSKVYAKVLKVAGTTKVPVDTFNKIWIMPNTSVVNEDNGLAIITDATLKVMLEQDYLAQSVSLRGSAKQSQDAIQQTASQVMRETILPQIEKDVNSGENFANLRQIYYSTILAMWFKEKFKQSFYKNYIDQSKIKGIDTATQQDKDQIFATYVEAFQKGLYNYVKKEQDPATGKMLSRKYFSGGANLACSPVVTNKSIAGALAVLGLSTWMTISGMVIAAGADIAEQALKEVGKSKDGTAEFVGSDGKTYLAARVPGSESKPIKIVYPGTDIEQKKIYQGYTKELNGAKAQLDALIKKGTNETIVIKVKSDDPNVQVVYFVRGPFKSLYDATMNPPVSPKGLFPRDAERDIVSGIPVEYSGSNFSVERNEIKRVAPEKNDSLEIVSSTDGSQNLLKTGNAYGEIVAALKDLTGNNDDVRVIFGRHDNGVRLAYVIFPTVDDKGKSLIEKYNKASIIIDAANAEKLGKVLGTGSGDNRVIVKVEDGGKEFTVLVSTVTMKSSSSSVTESKEFKD